MGSIQSVALVVFTLFVGSSGAEQGSQGAAATGQAVSADPLVLRLAYEGDSLHVKEWPKFVVTIRNRGDRSVRLVVPGDGSIDGWRTPIVGWSVLPVGGDKNNPSRDRSVHPKEPPKVRRGRCGLMNPAKHEEVFELTPGGTYLLKGWLGNPRFYKPGQYRVVFYYKNIPDLLWVRGAGDADVMASIHQTDACSLVSNELLVTVTEAPKEAK